MRLIRGVSQAQVSGIERARRDGPFTSVIDLARRSGASRATLARLAGADAMRSLSLNRRAALWQVLSLGGEPPMLDALEPEEAKPRLPEMSIAEVVVADYDTIGLSLSAHPISLIRDDLNRMNVFTSARVRKMRHGISTRVAGLVLVRQRPSTASGVVFCTLEDETGTANLVIRPHMYEKYRNTARGAAVLIAEGRVERQGEVVHINVTHLVDFSKPNEITIRSVSRDFH